MILSDEVLISKQVDLNYSSASRARTRATRAGKPEREGIHMQARLGPEGSPHCTKARQVITDTFIIYHKKPIVPITDNFILSLNDDITMKTISPYGSNLIALLRTELGFNENALIKQESTLRDNYPLQFDLIIEDGSKTYVVELKRIVRLEALSQLGLLKLLLSANNISTHNIEFVIAGKRITAEAAEAAEKTGIRFIKLPVDVNLEEAHEKPGITPVKLTSPKSWQVISYLLKIKETSIRQLAIRSGSPTAGPMRPYGLLQQRGSYQALEAM